MVGMHLTGRTDGGERMFEFDRLDSRSAKVTFDLDGNLQPRERSPKKWGSRSVAVVCWDISVV